MIQPGKETNYPTSSGDVRKGFTSEPLFKLDGFTITIGMVLVLILLWLLYMNFGKRRRR